MIVGIDGGYEPAHGSDGICSLKVRDGCCAKAIASCMLEEVKLETVDEVESCGVDRQLKLR